MQSTGKEFSGAAAVTSPKDSLIFSDSDASPGFCRERPAPGARDPQPPDLFLRREPDAEEVEEDAQDHQRGTATITPTMPPRPPPTITARKTRMKR
jgi:hypothetical protein